VREVRDVPELVRVSIGTAAILGLEERWLSAEPSTAYLMTYTEGRCTANCAFCPQARESTASQDLLSRVLWPPFKTGEVLKALRGGRSRGLKRICLQVINYPGFLDDVMELLKAIRGATGLPISLDTPPIGLKALGELLELGVERVCIPIDAATPRIFEAVKGRGAGGPYTWTGHLKALENALKVFGRGRVTTHLIIGLGETERDAVRLIQDMWNRGILTGLFALTPIPGTRLEDHPPPPLDAYRRIQVARHLIILGLTRYGDMAFDEEGRIINFGLEPRRLVELLSSGEAFQTSGCPGCNRPYYNERPRGPLYNYPRPLRRDEIDKEVGAILRMIWRDGAS